MKQLFLFYTLFFGVFTYAYDPVLLIKIPTRSRPEQFFKTLDLYYQKLSGATPFHFLITCDTDDTTMNCPAVIEKLDRYKHLSYSFSNNTSKVEAYNKDIEKYDFDILLVTSDDMEPLVDGFDKVIVRHMQTFPDYDGVLNFFDGHVGAHCNTLPVIGKKYYNRFGYVYNPAYVSLFCDNELSIVSKILRKEKVCNELIIKHNHPVWTGIGWDQLYQKNEALKARDEAVFIERRARMFDLSQDIIAAATPKLWSILICTLDERAESFKALTDKVDKQIKALGLEKYIEILAIRDNRELPVGFKRNELLRASSGKYVCFLDDDDDVHEQYVKMIYEALLKNPDCVTLSGIISHHGQHKKPFIHSLRYDHYFEKDGIYYRPPNHLNPMRRCIAVQFTFPESNFGEDLQWTVKVAQSKLLKTEAVIDEPYYFYQCSDNPLSQYY